MSASACRIRRLYKVENMSYAHPFKSHSAPFAGYISYTGWRMRRRGRRASLPLRARVIDTLVSSACLVLLAPAIAAVWIAIRRSALHAPAYLPRPQHDAQAIQPSGPRLANSAPAKSISPSNPIATQA